MSVADSILLDIQNLTPYDVRFSASYANPPNIIRSVGNLLTVLLDDQASLHHFEWNQFRIITTKWIVTLDRMK